MKTNQIGNRWTLILLISGLIVSSCTQAKQQDQHRDQRSKNTTSAVQPSMNSAVAIYAKPQVPVLCFHRIENNLKSEYNITPATFESYLKILSDSGYHAISPDQLYHYLVYNAPLPPKPVMITFDDSRAEDASIAAPLLDKYGFKGVFFIMTITYNKKNYMTTQQIAQLAKDGHTIGLHSWDHTMVTKYQSEADWEKQVINPKKKLEEIIGKPVEYWAYPDGVFNHQSAEMLSHYFKLSFSLSTKRDSLLPLQTVRRMIVPEWTPRGMLKAMHRTF
ncbi:MAG: polysaccharide deacetylase family protein [Microbacter sp.]